MSLLFKTINQDTKTRARAGTLEVNGHIIETPVYMPVGTQGTVKSLTPDDLEAIGAQIILANTYHLYLRPGADLVEKMGGLHSFVNWKRPMLTDSGGFQVFSLGYGIEHQVGKIANIFPAELGGVLNPLPKIRDELVMEESETGLVVGSKTQLPMLDPKLAKVHEDGVTFKSHLDGSSHTFNADVSIKTQHKLGADIILAFDECPSPLHDYTYTKKSLERTHRWERESLEVHKELESQKKGGFAQHLFGIPHGGPFEDLRKQSAHYINDLPFDGFSIGGSLGNLKSDMHKVLEWQIPLLDDSRPRHLLGIGDIDDLFECIERGIDMFDCVAPTRIARNGALFISPQNGGNKGNKFRMIVTNNEYKDDGLPIDPGCECYTCQNFSRAYVRHLFMAKELLAYRLGTYHNVYFIVNLVKRIRQAIIENNFSLMKSEWLSTK